MRRRSSMSPTLYVNAETVGNSIRTESFDKGNGGLNKVFLGFGYQLSNNLKIGVDASYNFGNITNTNIAFGYNEQGEFLQYHTGI